MLVINNILKHKIGNISLYTNVGALKKSLIETVLLSAQEHMYWFRKNIYMYARIAGDLGLRLNIFMLHSTKHGNYPAH